MPAYVSSQATELAPYSIGFAVALSNKLPEPSSMGYSCEWSYGGKECQLNVAAQVCSEDPQAAYAVMAIADFVNYLDDVFQTLQLVINTMTPQFATFPETFNPKNITTLPGNSAAGISGTALYFVSSLAGLIPGVELAGDAAGSAAKALGGIGAVAYMGGSAAGVSNIGGDSGNIEIQFSSFSTISGMLGDLAQAVADGFSTFATSLLSDMPPEGFESDPRQLPTILSEGGFAEPHPPFDPSMDRILLLLSPVLGLTCCGSTKGRSWRR